MKKIRMVAAAFCLMFCLTAVSQENVMATTINGKVATVGQVQNLKAGVCTVKSINIHWSPVQGASGYQIYRATARNGKYTCIKTVPAGSQAFMNLSVSSGKEYFYKVRAFVNTANGKRCGKFSKILRANTKQIFSKKVRAKYNVNVRKYAGTNYAVQFTVKKGTKLTVLCETCDKSGTKWYRIQVKINGKKQKGYVRSDLVA